MHTRRLVRDLPLQQPRLQDDSAGLLVVRILGKDRFRLSLCERPVLPRQGRRRRLEPLQQDHVFDLPGEAFRLPVVHALLGNQLHLILRVDQFVLQDQALSLVQAVHILTLPQGLLVETLHIHEVRHLLADPLEDEDRFVPASGSDQVLAVFVLNLDLLPIDRSFHIGELAGRPRLSVILLLSLGEQDEKNRAYSEEDQYHQKGDSTKGCLLAGRRALLSAHGAPEILLAQRLARVHIPEHRFPNGKNVSLLKRGLLKGLTVQENGPFAREDLQNEPILGEADLQLLRLYVPILQDEIVALIRTDPEDIPRQRVGRP